MKFSFLSLLFFTISLSAQRTVIDTLSPLQVVQQYVSPDGFPNKLKYFCCEMYQEWGADKTLGQQLPARVKRDCRLVFQDSAHATVAAWLHDSATSRDVYFYLEKKEHWTIYAARSLVMTNEAQKEIKKLDSIPQKERGSAFTKSHGYTFNFEYNNLRLWTSSDSALVAYFQMHKKQFEKLQRTLKKKGYYGKSDSLVTKAINDKRIRKQTDKLLIRSFDYDKHHTGGIYYVIGGMLDNTVGYLYQPDPKKLPVMTQKRYILIQPIGGGWYLFKTT